MPGACVYTLSMARTTALQKKAGEIAAVCSCVNLRQASRAVTQHFDAVFQPTGLKATQFNLLVALAAVGQAPLTRVAEAMVMDRTTLTRNLKPLEARGLVQIEAGEDRRNRLISLTDDGRKALRAALPLWEKAQSTVIEGLGPERMWDMLDDLKSVVTATQGK